MTLVQIKKVDDKYLIEIDKEQIQKGLLTPNELYNITFKFAKYECPLYPSKSNF